jgi:hypothetical protein
LANSASDQANSGLPEALEKIHSYVLDGIVDKGIARQFSDSQEEFKIIATKIMEGLDLNKSEHEKTAIKRGIAMFILQLMGTEVKNIVLMQI